MKRSQSKNTVLDICKLSENGGGNMILNGALEADSNGDCTVGRDLYVEDELIITKLTKIVDDDGEPLFNIPSSLTAGQYNLKLVVDATGKCVITAVTN